MLERDREHGQARSPRAPRGRARWPIVAGLALVAGALLWAIRWPTEPPPPSGAARPDAKQGATADAREHSAPLRDDAPTTETSTRKATTSPAPGTPPPETGAVVVELRFEDGERASGILVWLVAGARGSSAASDPLALEARSDDDGHASFPELAPGPYRVELDRTHVEPRALEVAAGETTSLVLVVPGRRLWILVQDERAAPVAGAAILLAEWPSLFHDPVEVGRTDAAGRFLLRGAPPGCAVGAMAAGYAATELVRVEPYDRTETLTLVVALPGGALFGRVTDPSGAAVPGASVRVSVQRREEDLQVEPWEAVTSYARTVRTGAEGDFRVEHLRAGEIPVRVTSDDPGLGPWVGRPPVAAGAPTRLDVVLPFAVRCEGTVLRPDGRAEAGARVSARTVGGTRIVSGASGADGRFELGGIPEGPFVLAATARDEANGQVELFGRAGELVRSDVVVSLEGALVGRVLDLAGDPVGGLTLIAYSIPGSSWAGNGNTDESGRFVLHDAPDAGRILILVQRGGQEWSRQEVELPASGELLLQVEPRREGAVRGRVLDAAGELVAAARILPVQAGTHTAVVYTTPHDADHFEIAGLPLGGYTLFVQAAGFEELSQAFVLRDEGVLDLGDLVLRRAP